jgi:small subunit ribosomal protein S15
MSLSKEEKKEIIKQNSDTEYNTGSVKVQIALLKCENEKLNKHFKKHPGDFHSKRGLLKKNKKRNTLIRYYNKQQN